MSEAEKDATTDAGAAATGEAERPAADAEAGADAQPAARKPVVRKRAAVEEPPPPPSIAQWAFLALVSLATAGLDLWSKAWAIRALSRDSGRHVPLCTPPPGLDRYEYQRVPGAAKVVFANFLEFRYAENCGGAWGLLHAASESLRKPFFMIVTVGAVLFILHMYRQLEPGQRSMRVALPLVLGGAIGNLVDRMRLGYVVDFIDAHLREQFHWPTFNVADIAITVGIGLMVLEYILGPKKAPAKAKTAAT